MKSYAILMCLALVGIAFIPAKAARPICENGVCRLPGTGIVRYLPVPVEVQAAAPVVESPLENPVVEAPVFQTQPVRVLRTVAPLAVGARDYDGAMIVSVGSQPTYQTTYYTTSRPVQQRVFTLRSGPVRRILCRIFCR